MKFTTPLNLWSCTSIIRARSIQAGIWPAGLASAKLAHDPLAINLATLAGPRRQWETLELLGG